jgi:hypothetical protein
VKRFGALPFALLLTPCGPDAAFDSACQKIKINICNHQAECGIEPETVICQRDFDETYICDPDATLEELEICSDAALTLECPRSTPFVCFDVLCDADAGCSDPVVPTTSDTGDTSTVDR